MAILRTLLILSIYSAVIYCAVMLFRTALKKYASPVLTYLLWFVLIARLMIPVTPDVGIRFITLPAPQPAEVSAADMTAADEGPGGPVYNTPAGGESPQASYPAQAANVPDREANPMPDSVLTEVPASTESLPDAAPAVSFDLTSALLLVWVSGSALGLFQTALVSIRLKKRLLKLSVPAPPGIAALAQKIKLELHLRAGIKIVILGGIDSPALTAGFRPVVIIPQDLAPKSTERLEFALRHKLMHYRRGDHIVCLLLAVLRAVYWFNPVVWLAARQMRMDMETACDSMVVSAMSVERKKSYANTILKMQAGEKRTRLLMGMALENTRKTAERRIRGIFMRSRSGRGAKAGALCLAAVLLVACFTTACQPVTAELNEPPMSSTAVPSQSPSTESASPSRLSYEAPSAYKDSFQANDNRVSVSIDAEVVLPEAAEIPVLRIEPEDITVDMVKKAANVLMEGKTLYEPRTSITRNELQSQIDALQWILDHPGINVEDLSPDDPETVRSSTQQFLISTIKMYREQMNNSPETYAPKEWEMSFRPYKDFMDPAYYADQKKHLQESEDEQGILLLDQYENTQMLKAYAELDGGYHGVISASKYSGSNISSNTVSFVKSRFLYYRNSNVELDFMPFAPCTISQDETYRMAQDLLDSLGITDMKLDSCRPARMFGQPADPLAKDVYGYYVEFVRSYDNIPLISLSGDYNSLTGEYNYPQVSYETVTIMIHEDQITSFSWVNPSTPEKTVDSAAALLPFDRVMEIFKEKAAEAYDAEKLTQYQYIGYDVGAERDEIIEGFQSGQINISRIELGYVRMKDRAQPGAYRLLPAWKFYGSDQAVSVVNGTANVYPGRLPNAVNTYLTVNALDGSILDNSLKL
jgi:beta-lactamase regulating signal transducer with metallopeptidase domain